MEKENEKDYLPLRTWGGARKGAGRKKNGSREYVFRAQADLVEVLDRQPNKSQFVQHCIYATLAREKELMEDPYNHDFSSVGELTMAENVARAVLPFLDREVAAGIPLSLGDREPAEQTDILDLVCRNRDMTGLMRIKGNSMIDAGIDSGDVVAIDFSRRKAEGKEIALCELNGGYTAKRVRQEGNTVYLVPANPDFEEIVVHEDDYFRVWGVITGVVKGM